MSKCLVGNISEEIVKKFNIDYSYIGDEDRHICMSELIKQHQHTPKAFSLTTSFVYMADVDEDSMSEVTHLLRKEGIQAICVASTIHNTSWTLAKLLDEVVQEHHLFQTMNKLKVMIQEVMKHDLNDEDKKLVMRAFIVLQEKDQQAMDQMITQLNRLL